MSAYAAESLPKSLFIGVKHIKKMQGSKKIKIRIPGPVEKILSILADNNEEAYVVGGCVRDCLMGRTPNDWDITTSALPEKVKSLFYHTVDTGIKHGTVTVIMQHKSCEVTTYRLDGKYTDSRHPDSVEFTPSLAEDLKRRDFTINAFAYNKSKGFVDLFDGLSDLENRTVRCVGEPDRRFEEDALRIMRAVRFAAQLSFDIEEETAKAISRHAEALEKVSMERIRTEFEKTILSDNPGFVNKYAEYGLAPFIIRDSEASKLCFDKESEELYEQFTYEPADDIKYLRLAAFLKNVPQGQAAELLKMLTYDNKTKKAVSDILKYKDADILPDRRYIKRALCEMGDETFDRVMYYKTACMRADMTVRSGSCRCAEARDERNLEDVIEIAEDIRKNGEPYKISMLDINGMDLINAGMEKGNIIGEALELLLERAIEEPELNSKEELIKIAAKYFL